MIYHDGCLLKTCDVAQDTKSTWKHAESARARLHACKVSYVWLLCMRLDAKCKCLTYESESSWVLFASTAVCLWDMSGLADFVFLCVCPIPSKYISRRAHTHAHSVIIFGGTSNVLWQFCVTLWIFDLKCVGEADRLILRDLRASSHQFACQAHRKRRGGDISL